MAGLAPEFDLLRDDWPLFAASDTPVVRKLNVSAPWGNTPIAQVAVAGERHVQDALFAAFSMFRQKDRWLDRARRCEVLERTRTLLQTHAEVLANEAARESGKPVRHCTLEVQRATGFVAAALQRLQVDLGDVLPVSYTHLTLPTICSV